MLERIPILNRMSIGTESKIIACILVMIAVSLIWLSIPKTEAEREAYLKRKCEQRGGQYYLEEIRPGTVRFCHLDRHHR
jgi:hypothetical protein